MNPNRPSLRELRQRAFKHSPSVDAPPTLVAGEVGNALARRWGRPSAIYGTWLATRLGLSAHQVTLAAWLTGLGAAAAIATGRRSGFIVGALLAHLSYWLDHVDGQVARWRGSASIDGTYLDYMMHHAHAVTLGFALGFGLALRSGELLWALAGFTMGVAWLFLGLHNDCRYKAFFQPLKRQARSYRIEGGAGGRPAPPAPWPRRGLGVVTWPCFKACEPHVILMALSGLALMAIVAPRAWMLLWRCGALVMAVVAPILVLGRVARTVRKRAVTAEFERWFRPWPET